MRAAVPSPSRAKLGMATLAAAAQLASSEHASAASTFVTLLQHKAIPVAGRVNSKTAAFAAAASRCASKLDDLVDIDANFLHEALRGDISHHIQAAHAAGVRSFVTPGSTLEDSAGALELAKSYPNVVYPTAGVHPYHVTSCGDLEAAITRIAQLAQDPLITCIGECGLDYCDGFPEPAAQQPWFERQVELACELQKPLFLHERLAFKPFIQVLRRHKELGRLPPCLVHCFTGTQEELLAYLDMEFYVGITGFICKPKLGEALRQAVPLIPLDRLMVETDAPYLGFPGCRQGYDNQKQQYPNVPAALPKVVQTIAECMGVGAEAVATASTTNAKLFFHMDGCQHNL